jgi:CBS domain-containing protein/ribosome-associated translation inhibitor RaiA
MAVTRPPVSGAVVRIDPLNLDDVLSLVAEKMWRLELPVIPVVSPEGEYAGIVSIFSILKSKYHGNTKVKSVVERVPVIDPSYTYTEIARMFVKTGQPGLPYAEGGRIVGVVSARRLLESMGLTSRVAARHISYQLEPLRPGDPVEKARKLLAEKGLRFAPVAEDERLAGVVRIYDLVNFIYNTPIRREKLGEVRGEITYFLEQPVSKVMTTAYRTVNVDSHPAVQDIAEGSVVIDSSGKVYGIISPYMLLRRLLPAVEEVDIPLRAEGLEELDFIARNLIARKATDAAKEIVQRARLLEMSIVIKSREKTGERRRYDAAVSVKLDKGTFSAESSSWDPVEAAFEAIESAYKVFAKTKEKKREKRISTARLRKALG